VVEQIKSATTASVQHVNDAFYDDIMAPWTLKDFIALPYLYYTHNQQSKIAIHATRQTGNLRYVELPVA